MQVVMYPFFPLDLLGCLEQVYEYTSAMEECVPASMLTDCQELLQSVSQILMHLREEVEGRQRANTMGRPALLIEEEQLSFFVDNGFKVEDMALMLGCSNVLLKGD